MYEQPPALGRYWPVTVYNVTGSAAVRRSTLGCAAKPRERAAELRGEEDSYNPVYRTICQSVAIHFGKMFQNNVGL